MALQQRVELYEDPGRPSCQDESRQLGRLQGTVQHGPWVIPRY